jgi:8-oxo-dGTP pyrophosphatase MutT (NUDIX family)
MKEMYDPDLEKSGLGEDGRSSAEFVIAPKEIEPHGKVFCLVLRAREKNPRTLKWQEKIEFPGGRRLAGEDSGAARSREFSAEAGHKQLPLKLTACGDVHMRVKKGDADKGGGLHVQKFSSISFEGDLRTEELIEPDGTILFPPVYMEARTIINDPRTKREHRIAMIKLLAMIANNEEVAGVKIAPNAYEAVAYEYRDVLSRKPQGEK